MAPKIYRRVLSGLILLGGIGHSVGRIQRGRTTLGPSHRHALLLLIALFLVQPVLGSSEILGPIVDVKISPPGAVSLVLVLGVLPGEISTGFPRPFVLMAHWAPPLPLGAAPCGTILRNAGLGSPVFCVSGHNRKSWACKWRPPGARPISGKKRLLEVGAVTRLAISASPGGVAC